MSTRITPGTPRTGGAPPPDEPTGPSPTRAGADGQVEIGDGIEGAGDGRVARTGDAIDTSGPARFPVAPAGLAGAGALGDSTGVAGGGYGAPGGIAVGVAAEGAVGVRELAADPSAELRARAAELFSTLGACVENRF